MISTVSTTGVSKRYGAVQAVKDVTFTLNAGETVALVGHNGAGKTTLTKTIAGEALPAAGETSIVGTVGYLSLIHI